MNKLNKKMIVKIIGIAILMMFLVVGEVFATTSSSTSTTTSSDFSIDGVLTSVKDFMESGKKGGASGNPDEIAKSFAEQLKPVGSFLILLGTAIAIGVTIVLGIQYALSASRGEDVAALKTRLTGFAIAALVFFAAYPIWVMVVGIIENLTSGIIA